MNAAIVTHDTGPRTGSKLRWVLIRWLIGRRPCVMNVDIHTDRDVGIYMNRTHQAMICNCTLFGLDKRSLNERYHDFCTRLARVTHVEKAV